MMEHRRGVIFDLDGVLVDTTGLQFLAWRKTANALGIDFSEEQNEELKGISREDCFHKILSWGNVKLSDEDFREYIKVKNQYYLTYIESMDQSVIFPGVLELLGLLEEEEIPFALGSASKSGAIILKKLGLFSKFKAVVDGNDVKNGKPDPEIFLLAAKKLNCKPSSCMVFEDSLAGIKAANLAGMWSIGVGNRGLLSVAHFTFNDLTEVHRRFVMDFPAV
ncbi:beta-phosphoglucomutase [Zunongwangia sp. H14]|uniref:beta-phosphoglucomutase n=1 Tax=Zunongwangia sp. H14 TaxID=3240792 RepID=UPI003562DC96